MSNTRQAAGARPFQQDDLGLGYCYACLTDYYSATAASRKAPPAPRFAITWAPAAIPGPGGGVAALALPSCYEHLVPAGANGGPRRQLLVP